jgi:zinc and cadmium transporter
MANIWLYSLGSVLIVSLVSFVGIFAISLKAEKLRRILLYLVSFSAGALLGDAFFHLIPEIIDEFGFSISISIYLLLGIIVSFIIEKFIHWRHCHIPTTNEHTHPVAIMNLVGDGIHNFIDGIIIGVSYLLSIPVGIATTIAVLLHELPQEIGDFGVLVYGGYTKTKALMFNFLTALTAILGVIISLLLSSYIVDLTKFMIPFAAGTFIYIAGSDLIPEIHKEVNVRKSLLQLAAIIMGILIMMSLLVID